MAFVGKGWRSGQSSDTVTGAVSTATVSSLNPSTADRKSGVQTLTVTGTGYASGDTIYVNYGAVPTTFLSATQLRTTAFNPMPDSGTAGTIPVGVRKTGQRLSPTLNFTAT
jgi:endonuclease YncB( thermonuclease family)